MPPSTWLALAETTLLNRRLDPPYAARSIIDRPLPWAKSSGCPPRDDFFAIGVVRTLGTRAGTPTLQFPTVNVPIADPGEVTRHFEGLWNSSSWPPSFRLSLPALFTNNTPLSKRSLALKESASRPLQRSGSLVVSSPLDRLGCGSFWTTGGLTHGTMLRLGLRPDLEEFFVFGMALPA